MNSGNGIARTAALIILGAGIAHASIVSSDIQPGDLFGPGIAIGIVPFVGVFNYAGNVDGAAVVPEPESWLLVAIGMTALMLRMRRAARLH